MATNFPTSLDSYTTKADGPGNTILASHVNNPQDAIVQLETKLGIDSSTPVVNSVLRGTAAGSSSWTTTPQVVDLTTTGDVAVNGGDMTSTAATFNLLNATVTTLNLGGAATTIGVGAAASATTWTGTSFIFTSGAAAAHFFRIISSNNGQESTLRLGANDSGGTARTASIGLGIFADNALSIGSATGGTEWVRITPSTGGVQVGAPTGGDKGAGTINAVAVYDDNVLLTDWAFDLYFDGQVNPDDPFWRGQQLYSLTETYEIASAERRLPWMVMRTAFEEERSLGKMVSRLWQGQEQQQIYLFDHDQRIATLEAENRELRTLVGAA